MLPVTLLCIRITTTQPLTRGIVISFTCSLVHVAAETLEKDSAAGRQRRASESDTLYERAANDFVDPAMNPKTNVDILQMLSKAQDEYDKVV